MLTTQGLFSDVFRFLQPFFDFWDRVTHKSTGQDDVEMAKLNLFFSLRKVFFMKQNPINETIKRIFFIQARFVLLHCSIEVDASFVDNSLISPYMCIWFSRNLTNVGQMDYAIVHVESENLSPYANFLIIFFCVSYVWKIYTNIQSKYSVLLLRFFL